MARTINIQGNQQAITSTSHTTVLQLTAKLDKYVLVADITAAVDSTFLSKGRLRIAVGGLVQTNPRDPIDNPTGSDEVQLVGQNYAGDFWKTGGVWIFPNETAVVQARSTDATSVIIQPSIVYKEFSREEYEAYIRASGGYN